MRLWCCSCHLQTLPNSFQVKLTASLQEFIDTVRFSSRLKACLGRHQTFVFKQGCLGIMKSSSLQQRGGGEPLSDIRLVSWTAKKISAFESDGHTCLTILRNPKCYEPQMSLLGYCKCKTGQVQISFNNHLKRRVSFAVATQNHLKMS